MPYFVSIAKLPCMTRKIINHYRQAQFLLSVPSLLEAPDDNGREVAFAGRSNAGKSSAINTITNNRQLARTSKTPGRTQHLVFFEIDAGRRLVDLPGYGFARVSEKIKRQWQRHMTEYLEQRQSLKGLILVMDVRHPLTNYDQDMITWCQHANLPLHILLTKADKLKKGPANNTLYAVARELEKAGVTASLQLFSSLKQLGIEDALSVLDEWLGFEDSDG